MFAAKTNYIHANCKFDKTLVQFQPPSQNKIIKTLKIRNYEKYYQHQSKEKGIRHSAKRLRVLLEK